MIAQFARPPEELSVPLAPLVLLGIAYAVLFVAGRVLAGRGEARRAEAVETASFVALLLAAVYTLTIAVYAVAMRSELIWEMLKISLILFGFFALLLLFMLLLEMAIGAAGRGRAERRRRRAPAPVPPEEPAPAGPPSAGQPG